MDTLADRQVVDSVVLVEEPDIPQVEVVETEAANLVSILKRAIPIKQVTNKQNI